MQRFQFRLRWLFGAMLIVLCLAYFYSAHVRHKERSRQEQLEELRELNKILKAELREKKKLFQIEQKRAQSYRNSNTGW